MSTDDHPIINGVLVIIVSTIILAILSAIWFFFRDVIPIIFSSLWKHMISRITIPWWIFWLLVILSLFTVWRFIHIFIKEKKQKLGLDSYKEDSFYGAIWRWSYLLNNIPDNSLWCFCPHCNTRLIYSNNYEIGDRIKEIKKVTIFTCETCHVDITKLDGNQEFALGTVERQIERKVMNGEWKIVVERKVDQVALTR